MIGQRTDTLRQELRETTWLERKYHRSLTWNKNRPVLGEIKDNEFYTPEFVKTKAKELKKKSLSINEFQQLQNAFLQSEENISAFFSIDNILHALVRELSGNDPESQLAAANCCCNLALGNTKTCTALAKATVPYLLATLPSINYNLVDICIWTIGNLAAGSKKAFKILYAQDCLRLLVSLLQRCDLVLLPSVIYAIMHFTYIGYEYIQDSEIIDVTRATIQRYTHHLDPNMIWLLAILSSKNICIAYIIPLLPSLVEWLHATAKTEFSDVIYTTGVVWILGNIVGETSGEAANNLLNNRKYTDADTKLLLDKLLRHQHIHLRKETLWLIGNLYNHSIPQLGEQIQTLISGLSSLQMAALSIGASF